MGIPNFYIKNSKKLGIPIFYTKNDRIILGIPMSSLPLQPKKCLIFWGFPNEKCG